MKKWYGVCLQNMLYLKGRKKPQRFRSGEYGHRLLGLLEKVSVNRALQDGSDFDGRL